MALTRREFLHKTAAAGVVAAAGVGGYSLYEPHELRTERRDIFLRRLPAAFDGFRIAHISDLHFGPFTGESEIGAAVGAVNSLDADLAVVTGDFVSITVWGDPKAAARKIVPCSALVNQIRARSGRFAVLGNHDIGTDPMLVAGTLQERGIPVLRNRAVPIERAGARIWLAGFDDAVNGLTDIPRTLAHIPRSEAVVALIHEPDVADELARYPVDLQLSGHSHGGQIRLPLMRPLYLPDLGRKYWEGYYRIGNLQLYTNRGLGTIGLPMRLNSTPEITLLTLRAG